MKIVKSLSGWYGHQQNNMSKLTVQEQHPMYLLEATRICYYTDMFANSGKDGSVSLKPGRLSEFWSEIFSVLDLIYVFNIKILG